MQRSLPALVAALAAAFTFHAGAQTLETPNFHVQITPQCAEGVVGCDKVSYVGTSKKNGSKMTLMGRQKMQMCADGRTPCRSLGYEFRNGNTTYFAGEDGRLVVTQGRKTLVDEQGEWKY